MPRPVVSVTLTNHRAWITAAPEDVYAALDDFWGYHKPGYRFSPGYRWHKWDGKTRLLKKGSLPSGLFRATRQVAREKLGIRFRVTRRGPVLPPLQLGVVATDPKYNYQTECVDAMCAAIGYGGGTVLAATGTGKTAMAARFFSRIQGNCLFVVDQLDLLYQAQADIAKWLGEPVGVVGDTTYAPARVTVGTIQTLHKHVEDRKFLQWYRSIGIVIVDELHEQMSRRNFSVLEKIKPIARYGLTATLQLQRKDVSYRVFSFAGPVLYTFPIAAATEAKVVTRGRVLQLLFPAVPLPTTDHIEALDVQVIENEVKHRAFNAIAKELVSGERHVIALVDRVTHLEGLSASCRIPHGLAYGKIKLTARDDAKRAFEASDTRLLIANKVFRKGVDIKRVDAMIDMAEMPSKNGALQKYGRGIRLHADKEELLYIDFGTYGDERFRKAAASRARAFTKALIPVKKVKVETAAQALLAVRKALQKQGTCKKPKQMKLF